MGFCRRCGDIVAGVRCKCGGTAVAPVIAWNHGAKVAENQDKWSKTYVSGEKRSSPVLPQGSASTSTVGSSGSTTSTSASSQVPPTVTTRRFPRPKSTSAISPGSLSRGVSEHIISTTSQSPRPPSPLKFSTSFADPTSDILPSLSSHSHEPSLSKVYGSVLQPKETLTLHSCAICSAVFPPDATIYPNPSDASNSKSFLCRPCFTSNGGSKGNCPGCSRPVLALKAEGGFINSGGKHWHKRCFTCAGCFKNISDTPMVDLLGRPTCAECFDNCLKRDHPATPKRSGRTSINNSPSITSPGGLGSSYGRKSREGSPMIDELHQRLGIVRSRESSPAPPEHVRETSPDRSLLAQTESPRYRHYNDKLSPKPQYSSPSPRRNTVSHSSDSPLRRSISYASISPNPTSEASTASKSSSRQALPAANRSTSDLHELSTSLFPANSPSKSHRANPTQGNPLSTSTSSPVTVTTSSVCGKCRLPILNSRQGGHFVTIPGADENDSPKLYHNDCFKCTICERPFSDSKKGHASFVHTPAGPCHVQCTPAEQITVRKQPLVKPLEISALDIHDPSPMSISPAKNAGNLMGPPSSRLERPLSNIQPKAPMPRFGGQAACPGCQKAVSPMERGVVPGPQGTRWHSSCLVCGGKKVMTAARLLGREDKSKGQPGCGKKLDSAAKSDGEGGIWCRECLLHIGVGGSPLSSPTRSPLVPSFTGSAKITPQTTGAMYTTLARQFTGMGGNDAILRQLTGGGLSPTRSISPTKQLGLAKAGSIRPRPKSVIGMRSTKSVDEGRGMFLVRQMTGAHE